MNVDRVTEIKFEHYATMQVARSDQRLRETREQQRLQKYHDTIEEQQRVQLNRDMNHRAGQNIDRMA